MGTYQRKDGVQKVMTSFYIDAELLDKVKALAEKNQQTQTVTISNLLKKALGAK